MHLRVLIKSPVDMFKEEEMEIVFLFTHLSSNRGHIPSFSVSSSLLEFSQSKVFMPNDNLNWRVAGENSTPWADKVPK